MKKVVNETEQKQINEKFYQELTNNMFISDDGSVFRATDIQEANRQFNELKKRIGENDYECVKKLKLNNDLCSELFNIISLIKLLENSEDGSDLEVQIYRSSGDYLLTLEMASEDILNKMHSMSAIVYLLNQIKKQWETNYQAVNFFISEMKDKENTQAA